VIPTLALDSNSPDSGSSNSTGKIVGGVVGGVAGAALIASAAFLFVRRRKRTQLRQQQENEIFDDEFYGDPYRQNNWSNQDFQHGFQGTGEQRLDDEGDEYYGSQQRKSWWSSIFNRSR
jgi:hypothetical protein